VTRQLFLEATVSPKSRTYLHLILSMIILDALGGLREPGYSPHKIRGYYASRVKWELRFSIAPDFQFAPCEQVPLERRVSRRRGNLLLNRAIKPHRKIRGIRVEELKRAKHRRVGE
jgi:hypothetical protein